DVTRFTDPGTDTARSTRTVANPLSHFHPLRRWVDVSRQAGRRLRVAFGNERGSRGGAVGSSGRRPGAGGAGSGVFVLRVARVARRGAGVLGCCARGRGGRGVRGAPPQARGAS